MRQTFVRGLLLVPLLVLTACQSTDPDVDATEFQRALLGSNEVPPIQTSASGTVDVTLDGNVLTVDGAFSDLEGDLVVVEGTPAHIHEAAVGATGGIVFGLDVEAGADDRSGSFGLTETLTSEQLADFEAGRYYVNVHSAAHPSGELRAQLHDEEPVLPGDLEEVAGSVTDLTALNGLLDSSGLLTDLPTGGTFTILAPNNEAVAAAEGSLPTDEATLTPILQYHVLEGSVTFDELATMDEVTTLAGETIDVTVNAEGEVVLNGTATIVKRNVLASNGLIHVIDGVLSPPPDGTQSIQVTMTGDAEVPAVPTAATGSATVTLEGTTLTVAGSYEGMVATASHIHGPAGLDESAGVLFPLVVDGDAQTISGEFTLTDDQLAELAAGLYYINVHSETYSAGEIRGQIVPPTP